MNQSPLLLAPLALAAASLAQAPPAPQDPATAPKGPPNQPSEAAMDLTELSLEELMEVKVEVAGRREESLAATAASVFVIDKAEIRRSGMRSVPELLRLVPGLIIAQDVPGAFGFSSRLGEHEFAGMLVLLDGERLYTTLLRREYFQAIDLPIENIERIEVVRGPGGARWGDKASQGVVNIVTKKAADAQGLTVVGLVGTEERGTGSLRWGGKAGEHTHYYVYGKLAERDGGHPTVAGDRWSADRVGLRADTRLLGAEATVDAEYHDSFLGDSYEIDPGYSSLNMIKGGHAKTRLRWQHDGGHATELRLAADAYDQDIRDYRDLVQEYNLMWREELYAATLQHAMQLGEGHQLTVGAGIRQLTVELYEIFADVGREYNETRGDLFASWDWDLCDSLRLTLGGNAGYLDGRQTTGVDFQPDLRLAWTPQPDFTVWTGVSANEEPDRRILDSGILVTRKSSDLLAWELGMRSRWGETLLLQVDTFVYELDDQVSDTTTDPGTGATLYLHDGNTHAWGGEASVLWRPAADWRLSAFVADTQANAQRFAPGSFTIEDEVPTLRGGGSLGWDPVPGLQLDVHALYTEQHAGIPTWWRVDLRVGWHCCESTTLEVVGQNLTDPQHVEYFYLEQPQRGVYFMVTHHL